MGFFVFNANNRNVTNPFPLIVLLGVRFFFGYFVAANAVDVVKNTPLQYHDKQHLLRHAKAVFPNPDSAPQFENYAGSKYNNTLKSNGL